MDRVLARLDRLDRWDQKLPARLRRPEVVLLAIAVVFAGGAAVRADRLAGPGDSGPVPLTRLAGPAEAAGAVLWFRAPLTPEQAAALVEDAGLDVAALRVELGGPGEPEHRDVALPDGASLAVRLELALEALAGELLAEAEELRGYAATTDMAEFTAQYTQDAERLEALAARDPGTCACVAALVVRGPAPAGGTIPGVDRVEIPGSP